MLSRQKLEKRCFSLIVLLTLARSVLIASLALILYNRIIGAIAQLGERLPCTQEVSSSILLSSTIFLYK